MDQTDFLEVNDLKVQDDLKEMKNGMALSRSNIAVDLLKEGNELLINTYKTIQYMS